jgi:hypothetical protein
MRGFRKLAVCLICWPRLHRSFSEELEVSKYMNDIELVVGGMTCRRCVRESLRGCATFRAWSA